MTYEYTLNKIMSVPMFQNVGVSAFIPTMDGINLLVDRLHHPERNYPTVHVAGTNGKGSVSSMLTSVLMEAGLKVGCYTSPHLADYRERVRINGVNVEKNVVCDFMCQVEDIIDNSHPSFFEITTALAFYAFSEAKVDIAIIETGLGGLTDSTNIISPLLSVITNIGYDHKYILGNSLEEIAGQKGGIIKPSTPAVIGEHGTESDPVFIKLANENNAPLFFAQDEYSIKHSSLDNKTISLKEDNCNYNLALAGDYQLNNFITARCALEQLRKHYPISQQHICLGMANVIVNSSFCGRWQTIQHKPHVVCDTGHNEDGIRYVAGQLAKYKYDKLYIVIGFMADKELSKILTLFPTSAYYIFTAASNPRAMQASDLCKLARGYGLKGEAVSTVSQAYAHALELSGEGDMIFVGGSTFTVADFLLSLED